MLDASDLGAPLRLDVDVKPSVSPVPQPYVTAVQQHRRCHVDGMPLDMYGDCAACAQRRYVEAGRSRRNKLIAFAIVCTMIFGVVAMCLWSLGAADRASHRNAMIIWNRNHEQITVYTMNGCQACDYAKAYMDQQGIRYVERRIDSDPNAYLELESLNKGTRVPTFVIQDEALVGFDIRGMMLEKTLAKKGLRDKVRGAPVAATNNREGVEVRP